jgi:hypothetical protein
MQYTTELVGVGCDWITATAKDEPNRSSLLRLGVNLMMEDAAKGNKVGPYKMARFVGGHSKYVGVGEWEGRVLVAVAGRAALDTWPMVAELAQNVSRIDLQVSVRQHPYDRQLAIRTWMESTAARDIEGKPAQFDLYARKGEGSTLYIGDGSSRYLARLYERYPKTREAHDLGVWRYEVEAKRERAAQAAEMLRVAVDPAETCYAYVHQHFAKRGVLPIFPPGISLDIPPLPREQTDDDKSLRWLGKSVRPVLQRLDRHGLRDRMWLAIAPTSNDDSESGQTPGDFPHP